MMLKNMANIFRYLRARNAIVDAFLELLELVQHEEDALGARRFKGCGQIEFEGFERMLISDGPIASREKLSLEWPFRVGGRLAGKPCADTSIEKCPADGACEKAVDVPCQDS